MCESAALPFRIGRCFDRVGDGVSAIGERGCRQAVSRSVTCWAVLTVDESCDGHRRVSATTRTHRLTPTTLTITRTPAARPAFASPLYSRRTSSAFTGARGDVLTERRQRDDPPCAIYLHAISLLAPGNPVEASSYLPPHELCVEGVHFPPQIPRQLDRGPGRGHPYHPRGAALQTARQ